MSNTTKAIAKGAIERLEALGLKDHTKAAQKEHLAYWCGAATALQAIGHEDAEHAARLAWLCSIRGVEISRDHLND